MNFKQDIEATVSHCENMTGKCKIKNRKAIKDLSRQLVLALYESDKTVQEYLTAYDNDAIIDPSFVMKNGVNWKTFIKEGWETFCEVMFELRPVGLGTPNAMVGEAEFMLVFGSPRVGISKIKNTGDVTVDGKTIELKGSEMRVMGSIKGKEVQNEARKIAETYGVEPNQCNGKRTAIEPWSKETHWNEQFESLGIEKSKEFLSEICSTFMECDNVNFDTCFTENGFSSDELCKIMLKGLWNSSTKLWDSYTVIDDGVVNSLSKDNDAFSTMVDENKVIVTGNYFRSFQDTNVGLYTKLVA